MTTLLHIAIVLLPVVTATLGTRWITRWVDDRPSSAPRSHEAWGDGDLPSQRYSDARIR